MRGGIATLALLVAALVGIFVAPVGARQDDAQATIEALQTQVAELQGDDSPTQEASVEPTPDGGATGEPAASEDSSSQAPSNNPVNLEIVLDVSGSMAQVLDTGETRLDAAKRVLNEVTAAVPDAPDVNVGLRIYGHEGDNTEAGQAVSCQSSDLIVPVEGVDRAAIAAAVAPLTPTGWTPIGLSLQRSAADFPASESGANNAVVLITDGLETCGGDPAAEAARLADAGIVTHVVGFALTPEEQALLQGITDASGGLLLGAGNASELTRALFRILEELEVVKGVGLIGGTAISLLPSGEPGAMSIVAVGVYDGNTLPFVVRNNTGGAVVSLSATGNARNAAGQLISTGGDQGLNPNLVRPGGLSIGYLYFGGADLPPDTTLDIAVEGTPVADEEFENQRDLEVVEAAFVDGRIVGTLRNGYDEALTGPFGVQVACFDPSGALIDAEKAFTQANSADPGETITFQAPSFGGLDCPLFLVAGGGFSNTFDRRHRASDILTPEAERAQDAAATVTAVVSTPTLEPADEAGQDQQASELASAAVVAATPGADGCYDLATAEGVVAALKAEGILIGEVVDYTAEDDPNELMGRPGGYTSKANFRDERLDPETPDFGTEDGGSVEVFASEADVERRIARLEAAWETLPILRPDVLFSEGPVLLRVSGRLLTADSDAYGVALQELSTCGD